ncbi:hypothetical protein GGI35DRAFT_249065 [Trichoderma velutinum]
MSSMTVFKITHDCQKAVFKPIIRYHITKATLVLHTCSEIDNKESVHEASKDYAAAPSPARITTMYLELTPSWLACTVSFAAASDPVRLTTMLRDHA